MKKRRILTSLFAIVLVLAQLMAVCAMPVSALAEEYGAYKETMPSASTERLDLQQTDAGVEILFAHDLVHKV